jgi:F0F1-type ATP synthase beta subunit
MSNGRTRFSVRTSIVFAVDRVLDEYLAQPFHVAEPVTGQPGESVSPDVLNARVTDLLHEADVSN